MSESWRIGWIGANSYILEGDRVVCACTPADAGRIVAAMNARPTAEPPPGERNTLLSEIEQLRTELDKVTHSARELKRMHDECHRQRNAAWDELKLLRETMEEAP